MAQAENGTELSILGSLYRAVSRYEVERRSLWGRDARVMTAVGLRQEVGPCTRMTVAAVFAFGLVLRVALIFSYHPAFMGIPDSGTYIQAASTGLFSDPVDPIGYAMFVRLLHTVDGSLLLLVIAQHALGMATAVLLFAVGRVARNVWVGLVAAASVLLNGLQIWVEHTPMGDPLFTFLCAAILYLAVRSRTHKSWWCAIVLGAALGCAPVVRSVGLLLIPLVFVWIACVTPGRWRWRLSYAAVPALLGVALVLGYAALEQAKTGVFGLTESDGRIEYAVAAPFADCSKFSPPAGTRGLCQTTAPARRGSFNQYLWGFPDHASHLPPGGRAAVSPAWRLFGPMPGGNGRLGAFGRAAILHQPGAFIADAWTNMTYYWRGAPTGYIDAAADLDPDVLRLAAAYYHAGAPSQSGFGLLKGYALDVEIGGWPLAILLFMSPLGLLSRRGRERAVAGLAMAMGWLLLGGSALIASDPRYSLPGIGPLALALALGVGAIIDHTIHLRQKTGIRVDWGARAAGAWPLRGSRRQRG